MGKAKRGGYLHLQPGIILGRVDGVAPVSFQQQVLDFDKHGLKGVYGDAIVVVLAVGVHPALEQAIVDRHILLMGQRLVSRRRRGIW